MTRAQGQLLRGAVESLHLIKTHGYWRSPQAHIYYTALNTPHRSQSTSVTALLDYCYIFCFLRSSTDVASRWQERVRKKVVVSSLSSCIFKPQSLSRGNHGLGIRLHVFYEFQQHQTFAVAAFLMRCKWYRQRNSYPWKWDLCFWWEQWRQYTRAPELQAQCLYCAN